MVPFCDLPDIERFRLRDAINDLGGAICSYQGDAIQVALPTAWRPYVDKLERLGLELVPTSIFCFPLGTDKAPENQRHDGDYPGSKAFWMYANFIVPDYFPM